jgi:predicted O-methyltransferase YrrM
MSNRAALKLFYQRLKYFLRGNYHGVSVGWLIKQGVEIQDTVNFFVNRGHDIQRVMSILKDGSDHYDEASRMSISKHYSQQFNSERELSCFLYTYVLLEKPAVIVETGVANGVSTKVVMSALEQTGGCLNSFDIDEEASSSYCGEGNWNFHKLPKKDVAKSLLAEVAKFNSVDLWIHDSNHGFKWQYFEYKLAILKLLPTNGLLVSDDIDASTAWGTLANSTNYSFKMAFDNRKFIGYAEIRK